MNPTKDVESGGPSTHPSTEDSVEENGGVFVASAAAAAAAVSNGPKAPATYNATVPFQHQVSLPRSLQAIAAAPPVFTPHTKPPKEALQAVYRTGEYKAALTLEVLCLQSFMAGVYIAIAGHLYLAAGGGVLGAAFFATGLIAVLLTSGELFTGDALIFVASVAGGKVSFKSMCRNWTVSWLCNFCGCLVWAAAVAYLSDALHDVGADDLAVAVALKKANQPWGHIFVKGIGANIMVCLGVWQFTCAEEVAGKVLALWFPITGFVIMGLDHCIANQFLIPVGMMLGADISVSHLLFQSLLPATLGNLVGGGVLGLIYWYVFDSMDIANRNRERIHRSWTRDQAAANATPTSSSHGHEKRRSELFRRFRRQSAPVAL